MNKKENSGYQKTHRKIQETLLSFLEKKDLKQITVAELCKQTNIIRSTFYAHFVDLYAVMEALCEEMNVQLVSRYQTNYISGTDMLSMDYLVILITHMYENKTFYRAYMSDSNQSSRNQMLGLLRTQIISPIFERLNISERTSSYYFEFFIAGFLTVLKHWLDDDCPESPEEIAAIISSIMPDHAEKLLVFN